MGITVIGPGQGPRSDATPLAPFGTGSSGTSTEVSRADHVHPALRGELLPSGGYVRGIASANGAQALVLDQEACVGMMLAPQRIDKLAIACNVIGGAGAVVRVGLRADSGNVSPGLPVHQQTIAVTTTGWKESTSIAYDHPGGLLWFSGTGQGWGAGTAPTMRGNGMLTAMIRDWASAPFYTLANLPNGEVAPAWAGFQSGVSGALPNTFTPVGAVRPIEFWIKRA